MSKMLEHARAIGANYALIVHDSQGNGKFYKGYRRFYPNSRKTSGFSPRI